MAPTECLRVRNKIYYCANWSHDNQCAWAGNHLGRACIRTLLMFVKGLLISTCDLLSVIRWVLSRVTY